MSFLLQHAVALAIAVPLFFAFAVAPLNRVGARARDLWAVLGLLVAEAIVGMLFLSASAGNRVVYAVGGVVPGITAPAGFPIRIVLVADAISALVALVAISAALAAAIFALHFLGNKQGKEKFFTLLLLLASAMMGLSFTGDFFTMFVFVEIMSIASAGLVAFWGSGESFEAAFKYMVVSAVAALLLLFGVGLLYGQYGLLNIAGVLNEAAKSFSLVDAAALALISAALLLKSGAVPGHFWKPDAYQKAPAAVALVLLASGMVCLYLLFRVLFLSIGFAGLNASVGWLLAVIGMLSIFVGVSMALLQNNLKRLMGYAAVAETGYVLLAVGTALVALPGISAFGITALRAGLFHMINDVLGLGLLFLVVGAVLFVTGKESASEISGLGHRSRALAALFFVGMLAVSGMPPLNGFASKILIFESVFYFSPVLAIVGILGSIMMLAIFVKAFSSVFLGVPYKGTVQPLPKSMVLVMLAVVVAIVLIGLFPSIVVEKAVVPAANALLQPIAYLGAVL